jgi:uncharacterized protein YrrD
MPHTTTLDGVDVLAASGVRLGSLSGALFHLREPRVVGLAVTRPRVGGVVARKLVYVALSAVAFESRGAVLGTKRLPTNAEGERAIGASWDDTVLWDAMPVRSTDGEAVGVVGDVSFDGTSGAILSLRVSTGLLGDLAVGRLDVPGDLVEGFDGDTVVIHASYADLQASGGAAKVAAKTASAAKVAGTRVAKQAYDTGMSAAVAVGKSFKSGTGRRMLDKFREMTRDEDETKET